MQYLRKQPFNGSAFFVRDVVVFMKNIEHSVLLIDSEQKKEHKSE
jgi:hypothetical protein